MIDSIDLFNQRLEELGAAYRLDPNVDQLGDNYGLYFASKNGEPKDDYPALNQNCTVKSLDKTRYTLCCFSSAFKKAIATAVPSVAQSQH